MCARSRFLINKRDICLQLSRLFRRFSISFPLSLNLSTASTLNVSTLSPFQLSVFSFPLWIFPSTSQLPQRSTSQLSPRFNFQLSALGFPSTSQHLDPRI